VNRRSAIACIAGIFILDRLTKIWAVKALAGGKEIKLLPFFGLTYAENTGAAFSMLQNGRFILIAVSSALLWAMFHWRGEMARSGRTAQWGLAFAAGGALGNLWDRVATGVVIDFLHLSHWPVFNVADSFITCGAVMLGWAFAFGPASRAEGYAEK